MEFAHTIKTAGDCHNGSRAYGSNSSQVMYHAAPNTLFAHMSGQPSSVNLETLGNMHQCQQTNLRKIILLPSIILCPVTAGLSQFSASLWICLPLARYCIHSVEAYYNSYNSYVGFFFLHIFQKGGFVKRGFSPPGYGPARPNVW